MDLPAAEVEPPLRCDFGQQFLDLILPCGVEYAFSMMFFPSAVCVEGEWMWGDFLSFIPFSP